MGIGMGNGDWGMGIGDLGLKFFFLNFSIFHFFIKWKMEKKIILGIKNTYYFFNKGFRCEIAAPDKTWD